MSSNKKGYSHISLEVAQENEKVFRVNEAGVFSLSTDSGNAPCEVAETVSENASEVVSGDSASLAKDASANSASLETDTAYRKGSQASTSANTPQMVAEKNAARESLKKDTASSDNDLLTYEDLEADVPFDKLRIVIIVILLLVLVGGVGYYLAFM
ncbi:MAG: hypothetical protein ACI4BI_02900 [Anaerotardibacter sp.]